MNGALDYQEVMGRYQIETMASKCGARGFVIEPGVALPRFALSAQLVDGPSFGCDLYFTAPKGLMLALVSHEARDVFLPGARMSTKQDRNDDTVSDLPAEPVSDDAASDVKGGATTSGPVPVPYPNMKPSNPTIPRAIDPCW